MTDSVITIPTAAQAPAPAPAPASASATAQTVTGNNPAASDTPANSRFQSALALQLQGQSKPGPETQSTVPGTLSALLQPVVNDGKPAVDKSNQDGKDSPLPGQVMPLDPSVLTLAPPPALPTGAPVGKPAADKSNQDGKDSPLPGQAIPLDPGVLAVAPPPPLPPGAPAGKPAADRSNQEGKDSPLPGQSVSPDPSVLAVVAAPALPANAPAPVPAAVVAADVGTKGAVPRLTLTPIASALAQDTTTPGQTAHTMPDLLVPLAPQHATVSAMHTAALAAELSARSSAALPATESLPTALTNVNGVAGAHAPLPSAVVPAAAMPPIPIPLAQPGWDQALGQRVQWLVGQQLQGAELRITPPHLGPIEVRISIGHDQQTVVNFASPHAAVRDAIEAAAPRLRDMLGNNGQDLVNVNVSQHSFAEQRRQSAPSGGGGRDSSYRADLSLGAVQGTSGAAVAVHAGAGLVDYFA